MIAIFITTVPYPEHLNYQEVATKILGTIQPTPIRNICDTYFWRLLVSKLRNSLENQPMRFSLRLEEPKITGVTKV